MVLLGMAGLAEAAVAAALGLMCIGVFLMTACAAVGLLLRSRAAAVIGFALVGVTAFLFLPWEAFAPAPTNDPDAVSLQDSYRGLARWWVLATAAVAGAAARAFWRRRPASPGERGHAGPAAAPDRGGMEAVRDSLPPEPPRPVG
jgi:threonine/homoserine/homoserine lactone efflux protein